MTSKAPKILVVRNDKLGDFMLAWPAFATLKQALPDCQLHALVSDYTAAMARLCPNIDQVIVDPGEQAGFSEQVKLVGTLKQQRYDAVITLFSTTRIGWLTLLAGIPYRLAPATKIAQIFYHTRLKQRRSRSEKPEYAYNQDLVLHYLKDRKIAAPAAPQPPLLTFPAEELAALRQQFCQEHNINSGDKLIFIHPGCGGSANNLTLAQYAQLGKSLRSNSGHTLVISAGPSEISYAEELGRLLGDTPNVIYRSVEGLERFSRHIAIAALFISGSTGPLHIAGALNCNTAAFYPRRRSATSLRWQTTNAEQRRLAFSPLAGVDQDDMSAVDIAAAAQQINERFLLA